MIQALIIVGFFIQLVSIAVIFSMGLEGRQVFFLLLPIQFSFVVLVILFVQTRNSSKRLEKLFSNSTKLETSHLIDRIDGNDLISQINDSLQKLAMNVAEAERKERAVVHHAISVICSVNSDLQFISVNPAVKKIWGYEPEELIGSKITDLIPADDREGSLNALLGADKSVDKLSFENRIRKKDGTLINLLWSAHWSAADKALFCVSHDITERKKIEKILEESEARFREIFSRMPVGLLITNELGIIEMSNPAIEQLSGYEEGELVGTNLKLVLLKISNQDLNKTLGKLAEFAVYTKSGEPILCQLSSSEFRMGGANRFLLVLVDMSEKQKLEQIKQAFFAMVSHDLRSPLTSLLAMLDSLNAGKLGALDAAGREVVERNARETGRLINLVNELLDIEKMRAGEFEMVLDRVPVDRLVESSVTAVQGLAQLRQVKLSVEPSNLYVTGDESLLVRVLVNLLANAIKYSPENSTVEVKIHNKEDLSLFSVLDSGPGIPAESKESIFELFRQLNSTASGNHNGTGLGLTICKMIVEQHGGEIWVEDRATGGSNFQFTIPRKALPFESLD